MKGFCHIHTLLKTLLNTKIINLKENSIKCINSCSMTNLITYFPKDAHVRPKRVRQNIRSPEPQNPDDCLISTPPMDRLKMIQKI